MQLHANTRGKASQECMTARRKAEIYDRMSVDRQPVGAFLRHHLDSTIVVAPPIPPWHPSLYPQGKENGPRLHDPELLEAGIA